MHGAETKSMSATQNGSSSGLRSYLMHPVAFLRITVSKSKLITLRGCSHAGGIATTEHVLCIGKDFPPRMARMITDKKKCIMKPSPCILAEMPNNDPIKVFIRDNPCHPWFKFPLPSSFAATCPS